MMPRYAVIDGTIVAESGWNRLFGMRAGRHSRISSIAHGNTQEDENFMRVLLLAAGMPRSPARRCRRRNVDFRQFPVRRRFGQRYGA